MNKEIDKAIEAIGKFIARFSGPNIPKLLKSHAILIEEIKQLENDRDMWKWIAEHTRTCDDCECFNDACGAETYKECTNKLRRHWGADHE